MKKIILPLILVIAMLAYNPAKAEILNSLLQTEMQQTDTLSVDIVKTSPNQAKILMENEHVRVVEYVLKPGEKDVWHTHPPRSSYVISGGTVKVYSESGEPKVSEVKTGASSWAGHGAKHYVENAGHTTIKIILTEIKSLQNR